MWPARDISVTRQQFPCKFSAFAAILLPHLGSRVTCAHPGHSPISRYPLDRTQPCYNVKRNKEKMIKNTSSIRGQPLSPRLGLLPQPTVFPTALSTQPHLRERRHLSPREGREPQAPARVQTDRLGKEVAVLSASHGV